MKFIRKIAFPFSILYGIITGIRNFLYDNGIFKSEKFKTPTIVVGNLSVGGTGKTPQIEYLINLLRKDYKIAVLSRGYKRKSKGLLLADEFSTTETLGDEPYQIHSKFPEIIVCVDANRVRGISTLEQLENPPEIILLDDAFQHRKVAGGLNILLTPYHNLFVDDYFLPTGNLRESCQAAKRAQIIIVSKCPIDLNKKEQQKIAKKLRVLPNQHLFFSGISYDYKLKGFFSKNINELQHTQVLLITGIANPTPLKKYLTEQKIQFTHLEYPDHYSFEAKDIKEIKRSFDKLNTKNKIIITTEKDYVRIFEKLKDISYISIKTTFINRENDFNKLIIQYVERGTGNS